MLIILRESTKHANFRKEVQYPLKPNSLIDSADWKKGLRNHLLRKKQTALIAFVVFKTLRKGLENTILINKRKKMKEKNIWKNVYYLKYSD